MVTNSSIDAVRHREKLNEARRQGQHDRVGWEELAGPWEFLRPPGFFFAEDGGGDQAEDGGGPSRYSPAAAPGPAFSRAGDKPGGEMREAWRPKEQGPGPWWPRMCLPGLDQAASSPADFSLALGDQPYGLGRQEEICLLDRRRTLKANLRRRAKAQAPLVGDIQLRDRRRRCVPFGHREEANPVVILLRDISASTQSLAQRSDRKFFWALARFLEWRYPGCEIVFLVHHVDCREVTSNEFFSLLPGGGTRYSSGYRAADAIIAHRYGRRSVYFFHLSDGDNLPSDYLEAGRAARALSAKVQLFAYGELSQQPGLSRSRSSWMGYLERLVGARAGATPSLGGGQKFRLVRLEAALPPWAWLETFLEKE
ncbi:MAG: DUF444 family protein [Clostridia bacterium]|nr:DUF444 family protein [Clostridia bacterium]